ncbi:putative ELL-associated factor 2 [Hypsibius exemplaris]|uniref:Ell-associated factor Eaf n=1 Tax=Hypsibius exemplaris TaxID=2072580 RepID=A0A9X6NGG9_HYPEX|nr:putative ELL-associated factor 2 [Hypsibius exemplaris]
MFCVFSLIILFSFRKIRTDNCFRLCKINCRVFRKRIFQPTETYFVGVFSIASFWMVAMAAPNEHKQYRLKLGKSFDKRPEFTYNTMRFDFKPVSLGTSKDLTMDIGGDNGLQVTATMAGKQASGSSQSAPPTVYKGSKKPYTTKECVLVVDDATGEVTLERLGDNVQLKKARPEGSSRSNGNRGNAANSPSSDKMDLSPTSTAGFSPAPSASPMPSPLPVPEPSRQKPANAVRAPPAAVAPTQMSRGPPTRPPAQPNTRNVKDLKQQGQSTSKSKEPEHRMSSSSSSSSSSSGSGSSSSDSEPDEPVRPRQKNIDDILEDDDIGPPPVVVSSHPAAQKTTNGTYDQKPSSNPLPTGPTRSLTVLINDDLHLTDDSEDDALTF